MDALANKWWSFFDFQLEEKANDGKTIVGAVYKWKGETRPTDAPEIVVAFRGTHTHNPESFVKDINLDLQIFINGLHKTPRFRTALDLVQKYVSGHGANNVWIAGHSLGAAIAMLVGRQMAEDGYFLQAHLFNPLFPSIFSALPEKIKSNLGKIRQRLLGVEAERSLGEPEKAFVALHDWFPCLYINNSDKVCSGFVEYFNQALATPVSMKHMLLSAIGIDSKVAHFIPSATLTLNLVPATDLKSTHMIDPFLTHKIYQWFAPDLKTDRKPVTFFPQVKTADNVQHGIGTKYC